MKRRGRGVLTCIGLAGFLALAGCGQSASGQRFSVGSKSAEEKLQIIEIVARRVTDQPGADMRPAFPADTVEIAIKTGGKTSGADLSVKMISLADGLAVGTRTLQLNAANAGTPRVRFEPVPAWAPGRYLFEVSLDGKLVGSQELEIFPLELAEPSKS